MSIMVAVGRGATMGVLFKDAQAIETACAGASRSDKTAHADH
jgi:cation transport ATPase